MQRRVHRSGTGPSGLVGSNPTPRHLPFWRAMSQVLSSPLVLVTAAAGTASTRTPCARLPHGRHGHDSPLEPRFILTQLRRVRRPAGTRAVSVPRLAEASPQYSVLR